MSLTPFLGNTMMNPTSDPFWNVGTANDPFWNTNMPGMDVGFPNRGLGGQVGFPNMMGGQMGFPNLPTPQLGIDLTEETDKWVVHADLPGFKDEDVELSIENGMLGVRGKREKTEEFDTGISHRVEVGTRPEHNTTHFSDRQTLAYYFASDHICHLLIITLCFVFFLALFW
jgi:HSP20 family molecular chaperone IbpA